ncbi:GtrA family protein [Deminuibacter soli]|uniref:GtrA family protein n=1 Tax=Deminuibacter soli TaxID=2291815 RepID=A0A3E1NFL9_9BACT|nr:GtrA family protein [Deminuibacter soli]RFM26604.1 GtrA family protein [Deminuibacter soli]
MEQYVYKFLKFGVVGVMGVVIDFGLTWFFKEKLRWNKYLANVTGFSVAVINNFFFNRFWTFKSTNPNWGLEFGKFALVSTIGLLLNNLCIYIFHQRLKFNFYTAKVFATGIVFVWNFTSNMFFTFR